MPGVRATYDQHSDALTIVLADAEVEETKNIAPGVELDYDSTGRVVAIEVLNASSKYDVRHVAPEAPDPYLSLAEAGELVGISPTTLRHQIARGVLPGTKIGRNWAVHHRDLVKYAMERSTKTATVRIGQDVKH